MQVGSSGKVRRSESEWREIFKRWEQSGLSRIAYCTQEGISKASFDKWKRRLLREGVPESTSFVELSAATVPPPAPVSMSLGEFEMVFPGGVVLRWKS